VEERLSQSGEKLQVLGVAVSQVKAQEGKRLKGRWLLGGPIRADNWP
jgi:hypothetical protein